MINTDKLKEAVSKMTKDTFNINPNALFKMASIDLEEKIKEAEEWVWIEGYKGTYRDMTCANDYQFELGKRFDMDCEGDEIKQCEKGFHLCLTLA